MPNLQIETALPPSRPLTAKPKRWDSRTIRLLIMLVLCAILFVTQITVGYMSHSVALIADAFHMLSDVLSLIVAMYAIHLAKQKNTSQQHYTYGWQRAEVLGALINAVFLIALCFTIFLEAIKRFVENEGNLQLFIYSVCAKWGAHTNPMLLFFSIIIILVLDLGNDSVSDTSFMMDDPTLFLFSFKM